MKKGDNFGWPYCYYDQIKGKKVLGPEYGGDGDLIGRCKNYKNPEIGFPGHWAPNDLVFTLVMISPLDIKMEHLLPSMVQLIELLTHNQATS